MWEATKPARSSVAACAASFTTAIAALLSGVQVHAVLVESSWDSASNGTWNTPGDWDPAAVPDNAGDTYNVTIDQAGGVVVDLNINPTIEDLTIGTGNELLFQNSRDLFVNGDITNNGLITIVGLSSATDLVGNSGDISLTGTGELALDGGTTVARVRMSNANDILTNGTGHTISGRGNLGANAANFINNGTVTADRVGLELRIDPTATFVNSSDLRAENEGLLALNAAAYDNTNGTITADGTNAEVRINSQANVTGGSFNTVGDGVIRVTANATLTDITNNGTFIINNGVDPTITGTLTNDGTFTQAGTGSNTAVQIDTSLVVSGGGTWRLGNAPPTVNTVQAATPGSTLTHGASHTIAGAGNLGNNTLGITNHGLIVADSSNFLYVDPGDQDLDGNGTDFINSAAGTLRATGVGRMSVRNGTFRNDNVIEAVDGGAVEFTGATVVGGTLRTANGGTMNIVGNGRFEGVTISAGSEVGINNGIDPVLAGIITNNGTLRSNGTGSNTATQIDGAATLTGSGEFVLGNAPATVNTVQGDTGAGDVLTHTANHTISGAGNLGNNLMAIDNAGTIRADQTTNLLTVNPNDQDLDGNGADVINSGVMFATGGGTLRLLDGRFANQTVIRAEAGSSVELSNSTYIDGGTLTSIGDGDVSVIGSNVTLDGVSNTANLLINNNQDPFLTGTFTNNGTVNQNGTGNNTAAQITDNVVFTGGGQWVLNNAPPTVNTIQGATAGLFLTNSAGHTIRGAGNVGNNSIGLINNGLVQADQTNNLIIDPSDVDVDGNGTDVLNTNTLRASAGGRLTLRGGVFKNQGFITAEAGSTVDFEGSTTIEGGSLQANGDGVLRVTGQSVVLDNVALAGTGSLQINNNFDPFLIGTFINNATVNQNGTGNNTAVQLDGNVTFAGNGTWVMNDATPTVNTIQGAAATEVLTNSAGHTIRGAGNLGNGLAGLDNLGTVIADGSNALLITPNASGASNKNAMQATGTGGLTFNGTVTNEVGASIQIDAGSKLTVAAGTFTHKDGATLTQAGDLIVNSGGTFRNEATDYSPGASPGLVTVTGSGVFENAPTASVLFEIDGGATPGVDFDTIRGTGIFNLAGEIDIALNFTPNFYESIDLIRDTGLGSGVNGTFDSMGFDPIVGVGEALALTYSANFVRLTRALPGDANLSGQVEQGDLDAVLQNWGNTTNTSWNTGDMNGSGQVEQGDLDLVLQNWGDTLAPDFRGFTVPEPSAALVLLTVALPAWRRRAG